MRVDMAIDALHYEKFLIDYETKSRELNK